MEVFKKEVAKYVSVEVIVDGGKLKAIQSLDIAALLDEGAAKLKESIPGEVEHPFVDAIVLGLKKQMGLEPVAKPAAHESPPLPVAVSESPKDPA